MSNQTPVKSLEVKNADMLTEISKRKTERKALRDSLTAQGIKIPAALQEKYDDAPVKDWKPSFSVGEYKGRKMCVLKRNDGDKFPFQFGPEKARLILALSNEIAAFAVEQSA